MSRKSEQKNQEGVAYSQPSARTAGPNEWNTREALDLPSGLHQDTAGVRPKGNQRPNRPITAEHTKLNQDLRNGADEKACRRRTSGQQIFGEENKSTRILSEEAQLEEAEHTSLRMKNADCHKIETSTQNNTDLGVLERGQPVFSELIPSHRSNKAIRAKSLEKVEGSLQPAQNQALSLQKARERVQVPESTGEDRSHFVDLDPVKLKTRVIARGGPSRQQLPAEDGDHWAGRRTEGCDIPRDLTQLLNEIDSEDERFALQPAERLGGKESEDNEDEEEFDFDKESLKCQEQLNQIKDAYVVDLPDFNVEDPVSPGREKEGEKKEEGHADRESPSGLKKILYFSSLAATTGFYFFMRKHNLL